MRDMSIYCKELGFLSEDGWTNDQSKAKGFTDEEGWKEIQRIKSLQDDPKGYILVQKPGPGLLSFSGVFAASNDH